MVATIAFYFFATILVGAGFAVITARNPVHSVLFLILAFFNAAALFVLLGAEFLAMILLIVYVGAVAVLFLFVVMMLDIDFSELRKGFSQYLFIGGSIGALVLAELTFVAVTWGTRGLAGVSGPTAIGDGSVQNTVALGRLIYTDYIYAFQAAGLILLVAMIGAIVLTHRTREGVKRQDISAQVARKPGDAIIVQKVQSGEGL